uniref:Calcium uniporter protein C-terminal domain-containing protein n=1 Tax=Picea sitchensis TaxID=3332 RepID=D5A9V4_PICSI|nr:unknown [Picea sitchensis]
MARALISGVLDAARSGLRANVSRSVLSRRCVFDASTLPRLQTGLNLAPLSAWSLTWRALFSTSPDDVKSSEENPVESSDSGKRRAVDEARKLLRLADVEALKKRLESDGHEFIMYPDLLKLCQATGVAHSDEEAAKFAKVLDEAGVVLIFRNKVIIHPHKVAELVRNAVPLELTAEDDPRRQELEKLQKEKEEIDRIAHKHVRRVLWSGLGSLSVVTILFFRLTFWEFSWDVMEPIAFFGTTGGLIIGYLYFLVTSRDPTYQDFMKRLFLRRQMKLCKKRNFDLDRFLELQKQSQLSLASKRNLEALVGDKL